MVNEVLGLKNINLLTKEQYDGVAEPATDELWVVEIDSDKEFKADVIGWGMPNYNAVISVGNVTRTPSTNVVVHCAKNGRVTVGSITINGITYEVSKADSNGQANYTYRSFYIPKGMPYTTANLTEVLEIPLIGG
jgi:hypothetical protein